MLIEKTILHFYKTKFSQGEKMKNKFFAIMSLAVLLAMVLAACAPAATPAPAPEPEKPTAEVEAVVEAPATAMKVRVASDAAYPPFETVDEATKELVGFDIDLFNAIAEKAGLEVEYVNIGFDPLLAGMAQCQYDAAISAITITDERKANMTFSDPYFQAGQAITVGIDNSVIKAEADLKGKTIGTQLGTTGDILAKKVEGATVKAYDSVDLAFQDLINGQVEAVVADNVPSEGFVGKNPTKIKVIAGLLTSEDYGISVCKTKTELLDKINKGLAEVKAEGIIEKLNDKWIKGAAAAEEAAAPVAVMKVRVASDAAYPPFETVDEATKELVGFDIDLFNVIAEKAGLEVEYVNIGFDPLLAGMAQCQYDAAISAITITEERKANMTFSDPYFQAGQSITVSFNNDAITSEADLKGKTIGTQLGTTGDILAKKVEGATVKAYDSVDLAFQDLINGQVEAVVADNVPSEGFVGQNPTKIKVVGGLLTSEDYGISVCKTKTDLLAKINKALAEVKAEGTIEKLNDKWIKGAAK
jgi:ABC-type amino acid transport substrate-binding protein